MTPIRYAVLGAGLSAALSAGMPPAGGQEAPPPPTAAIVGRVTSDADGRPLARARIVATSPALGERRIAISGSDGRFAIERLPPGSYALDVSKSGFAPTALVPAASGQPPAISLSAGQRTAPIEVILVEAGTIAGRVLDEDGTPFAGAQVDALQPKLDRTGQRVLAALGRAATDDRGEFRIVALPPGPYIVAATDPAYDLVGDEHGPIEFGPTYYPGVRLAHEAATVRVHAGRASPGVEFRLRLNRPFRVSGRLVSSDDQELLSGAVLMTAERSGQLTPMPVSDVTIKPDGTFEFRNVPPGRYTIRARGVAGRGRTRVFGRVALDVSDRDVLVATIALVPGARLSGRVDFEGPSAPGRETVRTVRVRAVAADGEPFGDDVSEPLEADGRFEFPSVMPGEHVLRLEGLPDGWSLKSVHLLGREVTDAPIAVDSGAALPNLQIVASDVLTTVAGRVTDRNGRPRPDVTVVAFPPDPGLWSPVTRRLARARPDLDGQYLIRGLPPGDYRIVASRDVDDATILDHDTLERLSQSAERLTLATGERTTRDLTVRSPGAEPADGGRHTGGLE